MDLAITIQSGSIGHYRVKLSGHLNTETTKQYDHAIGPVLADPLAKNVYLDLSDLSMITSTGLGAVLRTRKTIEAKGGTFAVAGLQPQVAKVFEITRLLPREIMFASVDEADAYLATIQRKVLSGEVAPPKQ